MAEQLIWLVPVAVVAAGVRSPRGGLLVLCATLPLFGSPPGGPYLGAFDVAALAAIAAAWRAGPAPSSRLDWPVWAFLGVSAATLLPLAYQPPSWQPRILLRMLAALPGVEPWSAMYGWRALASLAIGVGLFVAVRRAFAGRSPRPLLLALAGGLGLTLLLGLAAHAGWLDLDAYRVKGGPNWEGRLHSLFFHSGWYAEYLVLAVPVSLGALLSAGWRWLATGIAALAPPTVFLTAQRGAWFTALGQLALAGVLWGRSAVSSRERRRVLLLGLALTGASAAAVYLLQPELFAPALQRARFALQIRGRGLAWQVAAELAADRPLLGWGIGAFSPAYHRMMGPPPPGAFDWLTAHNHYLMLSAERGVLGLAAFALLCVSLLGTLIAARRGGAETGSLATWLGISLAGLLAYGVVQYMFFLRAIEWLFWILAGLTAALAPCRRRLWTDRLAQLLLLVAVLVVPWRLIAVEPLAAEGYHAFGLHRRERSGEREFQWTRGYAAWRQERSGETLELELANGHPLPSRHHVRAVIRVDGREALDAEIPAGWHRYRLDLEPAAGDSVLVELEASPVFRPWRDFRRYPELEPSVDVRSLGVAVSPPPSGTRAP